jgi:hypothetical protein
MFTGMLQGFGKGGLKRHARMRRWGSAGRSQAAAGAQAMKDTGVPWLLRAPTRAVGGTFSVGAPMLASWPIMDLGIGMAEGSSTAARTGAAKMHANTLNSIIEKGMMGRMGMAMSSPRTIIENSLHELGRRDPALARETFQQLMKLRNVT